jgi:hypothetical protein
VVQLSEVGQQDATGVAEVRGYDHLLTMEVPGGYWRTRPGTRDHVFPANRTFTLCLACPRVHARAQADVPVSYPQLVVCLSNKQRRAWNASDQHPPSTSGGTVGGKSMNSDPGRDRPARRNRPQPAMTADYGWSRHFLAKRTGCDPLRPASARQSLCGTCVVDVVIMIEATRSPRSWFREPWLAERRTITQPSGGSVFHGDASSRPASRLSRTPRRGKPGSPRWPRRPTSASSRRSRSAR